MSTACDLETTGARSSNRYDSTNWCRSSQATDVSFRAGVPVAPVLAGDGK
jgi:hypothetical protein